MKLESFFEHKARGGDKKKARRPAYIHLKKLLVFVVGQIQNQIKMSYFSHPGFHIEKNVLRTTILMRFWPNMAGFLGKQKKQMISQDLQHPKHTHTHTKNLTDQFVPHASM